MAKRVRSRRSRRTKRRESRSSRRKAKRAKRKTKRRTRRRHQRGGESHGDGAPPAPGSEKTTDPVEEAPAVSTPSHSQSGGKKKKKGGKRKLNKYFQTMLAAKKSGAPHFMYNGHKYVGKKHARLGMLYKKA